MASMPRDARNRLADLTADSMSRIWRPSGPSPSLSPLAPHISSPGQAQPASARRDCRSAYTYTRPRDVITTFAKAATNKMLDT